MTTRKKIRMLDKVEYKGKEYKVGQVLGEYAVIQRPGKAIMVKLGSLKRI